jgi:hypothetical protein
VYNLLDVVENLTRGAEGKRALDWDLFPMDRCPAFGVYPDSHADLAGLIQPGIAA